MDFFALLFLCAFLFLLVIAVAAMLLFKLRQPGLYMIVAGVGILASFLVWYLVEMYYDRVP